MGHEFYYRILVVDDDPKIISMSKVLLTNKGYEVRTASNGFEALAYMRRSLPDLIISDLNMSKMSGFELLAIVRHRFPRIPVILITGDFIGKDPPECLIADLVLQKGEYDTEYLLKNIANLLESSPSRPSLKVAPVWVPRIGDYFVLTCTECLRSFSLPNENVPAGLGSEECIHCGKILKFIMEPKR